MIDPASIVGLTIAIFDQLLKLGERSAELTSDIRAFSDVSLVCAETTDMA